MASKPANDPHPQTSMLRFYSMGLVAANKALNSNIIEVTPIEHLPFADGQLTDTGTSIQAQGTDVNGAQYSTQLASSLTIPATWTPEGSPNRVTAPDVRRGEYVKLYQFGDADKYYWTTSGLPAQRKLETVTHAFSGSSDEAADLTHENSYYHEVSTHQGTITLHTSQSNGEFTTYDIQLNAKEGYFRMQDGVGNYIIMDSTQNHFEYGNSDESLFQVMGKTMKLATVDSIDLQTKALGIKADTVTAAIGTSTTWTSPQTTHQGNFSVLGALGLSGDMTTAANASGYGSAGEGKITIAGTATLQGSMTVDGPLTAEIITGTNITAPNLKYN
jgi:hypothetical protein